MSEVSITKRLEIESLQLKATGDQSNAISAKLFDVAMVQIEMIQALATSHEATIAEQGAEIERLNKRTDDLVELFIGDKHESPLGKKVMAVLNEHNAPPPAEVET